MDGPELSVTPQAGTESAIELMLRRPGTAADAVPGIRPAGGGGRAPAAALGLAERHQELPVGHA